MSAEAAWRLTAREVPESLQNPYASDVGSKGIR